MNADNSCADQQEVSPYSPSKLRERRTLKIEDLGDRWKRKAFSGIRLKGHWLVRAGFRPGERVAVIMDAPGIMQLRVVSPEHPGLSCEPPDVPTRNLPVRFEVNEEVRGVLADALRHSKHADGCSAGEWEQKHKYLPATHPARAAAPVCSCWQ